MNVAFMLHHDYQPKKGQNLASSVVSENSLKKTNSKFQEYKSATLSRVSLVRLHWDYSAKYNFASYLLVFNST